MTEKQIEEYLKYCKYKFRFVRGRKSFIDETALDVVKIWVHENNQPKHYVETVRRFINGEDTFSIALNLKYRKVDRWTLVCPTNIFSIEYEVNKRLRYLYEVIK